MMKTEVIYLYCCVVAIAAYFVPSFPDEVPNKLVDNKEAEIIRDKLIDQVSNVLKQYQKSSPAVFLGDSVPDPLIIPEVQYYCGFEPKVLFNMTVNGLSKYEVVSFQSGENQKNMHMDIFIPRINTYGTWKPIFGEPVTRTFNETLTYMSFKVYPVLVLDKKGLLQVQKFNIHFPYEFCKSRYKVVQFCHMAFFNVINPFIINDMNNNQKTDIDDLVKEYTKKTPKIKNLLSCIAVIEAQDYIRRTGYDSYHISEWRIEGLNMKFTDIVINGLSYFYKLGNIELDIVHDIVQLTIRIRMAKLCGFLRWNNQLTTGEPFGPTGVSEFNVYGLEVNAVINQTLNLSNKPVLDKLDIFHNYLIKDISESTGNSSEIIEKSLPIVFQHIIDNNFKEFLKNKVNTIFDDIQVEKQENNSTLTNTNSNEQNKTKTTMVLVLVLFLKTLSWSWSWLQV